MAEKSFAKTDLISRGAFQSHSILLPTRMPLMNSFSSSFQNFLLHNTPKPLCSTTMSLGSIANRLRNKGVCHTMALLFSLAIYIKKYGKQKKNHENSNISPCKNSIFKKSFERNQNPSRYYCNSITKLKFQHKPRYQSSCKIPHIKIDLLLFLPRDQNPLSYYTL
jgi:hypothetical protein